MRILQQVQGQSCFVLHVHVVHVMRRNDVNGFGGIVARQIQVATKDRRGFALACVFFRLLSIL